MGTDETETLDDLTLIRRMAQGDEAALAALHRRYAGLLYALGSRMLQQRHDVETCVQDAFLNVWKHARAFDPARASVKTWLVSVAHHRFLQELRSRPGPAFELQDWDQAPDSPDPVDPLLAQQALAALSPEQRGLIELAYFQGHSHAELAQLTGLPLGTVKSRLRAALAVMRAALEGPAGRGGSGGTP